LTSVPATPTTTVDHGREDEFTSERHVYEPHKIGLPPLRPYVREVWRRREFAREMARTDLSSQHVTTAFGMLWLVLNPLLLAGVYFVLIDILRSGSRGAGFFAHLMAGIFAYYFIADTLRLSVKSVTSGGRLILNTAFPRVLLPISAMLTAFFRFLPTLVIYAPVHLLAGLPINLNTLWVFPLIGMMVLFSTGMAMVVSAGQVYFRDLKNFLPYILRVWMYVTPVLYYAHEVPHGYNFLLVVNPLGGIFTAWSDALNAGVMPGTNALLHGLAWSVAVFVVGSLFFMSREREFAVRL
jgi:teichoic acid transport system permease protein